MLCSIWLSYGYCGHVVYFVYRSYLSSVKKLNFHCNIILSTSFLLHFVKFPCTSMCGSGLHYSWCTWHPWLSLLSYFVYLRPVLHLSIISLTLLNSSQICSTRIPSVLRSSPVWFLPNLGLNRNLNWFTNIYLAQIAGPNCT